MRSYFFAIAIILSLFIEAFTSPIPLGEQNVEVDNEHTIYEGDMVFKKGETPAMMARTVYSVMKRWPYGIVPYYIDPNSGYSSTEKQLIKDSLSALTQSVDGAVRFIERTTETDYLLIQSQSGCWSSVGKVTSQPQVLSLQRSTGGSSCMYAGIIMHEALHAIG